MTTAFLSLPLWMQFLAGFILLGLGLMFILMPFSIFGVKPRLEEVELQLNEVRAELRIIAMRLAQGGSDTGPSGEPIYAPPRRNTAQSDPAPRPPEVAPTAEMPRAPEPMPWSAQAVRPAPQRSAPERAESPHQAPLSKTAHVQREPSFEERRERPAPMPAARDDYSYAESGAQESIHHIMRPTHFDPPPLREPPRPPVAPQRQDAAVEPSAPLHPTPSQPAPTQPDADEAWRLRVQRQEMAPRAAAAEADRLREAEEAGTRRVRSEPTLRWPPRP
ncbi:hypothetical protein [Asaia astilbis]